MVEVFLQALDKGIKPTLVIIDIMMLEMSDWDILRKLEENPNWSQIPVIFMTARTTQTAEDMYDHYGVGYIKKPFDVNNFKEIIENISYSKQKYSKKMRELRFTVKNLKKFYSNDFFILSIAKSMHSRVVA
jgi:DNA-binding response OmpR family regulator